MKWVSVWGTMARVSTQAADPLLGLVPRLFQPSGPVFPSGHPGLASREADVRHDSEIVMDVIEVGGRPRMIASPGKLGHALLAYPGLRRPRERWQRRALGAALAVGADRWAPRGTVRRVRHVVSCDPSPGPHAVAFDVAGLAGKPRFMTVLRQGDDHYKPTLVLLDEQGHSVGYAKLGWTPATAAMVQREARALGLAVALGGSLRAPMLLGQGQQAGRPLLVTAPLPPGLSPSPSRIPPAVLTPFAGPPRAANATDVLAPFSVTVKQARARGDDERADLIEAARARLSGRWRDGLQVTRSHGDWVPWNVAVAGSGVWYAWDWEHYSPGRPKGFDNLHWRVLTAREHGGARWSECYDELTDDQIDIAVFHALTLLDRGERVRESDSSDPYPIAPTLKLLLQRLQHLHPGT